MNLSRKIAVLMVGLMVSAGAFAADFGLSIGGGPILGYSWSESETNNTTVIGAAAPGVPTEMSLSYKTNSFDVGAFIFADCTYAELSAGYLFQTGKVTDIKTIMPAPLGERTEDDEDYASHLIIIDILGKYPFKLNDKLSIFPAAGVGIKLPVAGNDFSDKEHDITWGLNIKAGCGLDFALSEALFLRGEVLYYFQVAGDKDAEIETEELGKNSFHFKDAGYYMGPQIKIAVGYKLPLFGAKKASQESVE
jgi:hypothetical protein